MRSSITRSSRALELRDSYSQLAWLVFRSSRDNSHVRSEQGRRAEDFFDCDAPRPTSNSERSRHLRIYDASLLIMRRKCVENIEFFFLVLERTRQYWERVRWKIKFKAMNALNSCKILLFNETSSKSSSFLISKDILYWF